MKRIFLSILIISGFLASCSRYTTPVYTSDTPGNNTPTNNIPASTASSRNTMEGSILYYVNEHRRSIGLSPLQMIDAANQQAYIHSRNMATGKTSFGHNGFSQRVTNISNQIGRISAAAENVAYGSISAQEVVDLWINSPGHRKNMEGNYNQTGIGTYTDRQGTLYFTQIFVRQ